MVNAAAAGRSVGKLVNGAATEVAKFFLTSIDETELGGGAASWEPFMASFGRRVDGPTGRRRSQREEVILAGSALTPGASRAVVVTDVSPSGAKLLGRKLPEAGADVLLTVGDVELFAEIAWVGHDECGISFESPLPAELTDHLKTEGRWAKVMGIAAS